MGQPISIGSEHWQIGILPETGAAIAFGRLAHRGRWVDFFRPTAEADYGKVSNCASFPLIPYSNRIRERRFRFRGKTYELRATKPDGTVMHGVGRELSWQVEQADAKQIVLTLASTDFADLNFPFQFAARLEYRVEGAEFSIQTTLHNIDERVMPAGFGHHPYFQRHLTDANDPIALQLPYDEYFELDANALPLGTPKPLPSRLDFRALRPLAEATPNDCLTSHQANQPIQFVYTGSKRQILLSFDPIFMNLVFYAPAEQSYFAVEPVTNANDGFNLYADGVRNSGVFELLPGQSHTGVILFETVPEGG